MQTVKTIEELQAYWVAFTPAYTTFDQYMNSLYYSLINMLQIEKRQKILEVGAGGGFLYNHSLARKSKEAHYTATDLTESMLETLCRRVGMAHEINKTSVNDGLNLTVEQANSECLKYSNNTFDCYIANLCLQLTPDPIAMVKEAFRVTQDGGVVGFTVWGDTDKSAFFTILPQAQAEVGIEIPTVRSNFHLNDRSKLIEMLESAGFENILCWNQFTPFHYRDTNQIDELLSFPTFANSIKAAGDKGEALKGKLIEKLHKIIIQDKRPIGFDGLLIVATKPKNIIQ